MRNAVGYILGFLVFVAGIPALMWWVSGRPFPWMPELPWVIIVLAFMITLGISLKHIPGIPESFFAWFYMGLGPGLLSAGIRFLIRWWKAK